MACYITWWSHGVLYNMVAPMRVVLHGGTMACCVTWWSHGVLCYLVVPWRVV